MRAAAPLVAAALLLSQGSSARAEPEATDPAVAEALFYEARALMKDGKYALACPKLEESLRLDYGIGTEYNLADCNEKIGKLATAWSGFVSAAAAAKSRGQPEREEVAVARARALEPRLPRIRIDVPVGAGADLEVERDGVAIGAASLGTPVPVDPGAHTITARAPRRRSWRASVTVAEGEVAHVSIPRELALAAEPAAPVATASAPVAPPRSSVPATDLPAPIVGDSAQRTVGWIVTGLGAGGLGVGAGFGLDSVGRGERSKAHCADDLCDPRGIDLRRGAIRSGDVATVATIAGGAALLGGLVLVLTAPRATPRSDRASAASLRAVPRVGVSSGEVSLEGTLP